MNTPTHPIIVVGSGHAAIEAAHAAARLGCDVLMVTLDTGAFARLSCNPAIGGIGKGHLVREIDAFGGVMGKAADLGGVHFRVLNRSRGTAVWGPRAQQDYDLYPQIVAEIVREEPRIRVIRGEAAGFALYRGRIVGICLADGTELRCSAAVITTGTFLRGTLFQGDLVTPGGRVGEAPSQPLSQSLESRGVRLGRFKTGTPPRLLATSVDFAAFEPQPGDQPPIPFSFRHLRDRFTPVQPQLVTHLAQTNTVTHQLVRENLDLSPLYGGKIRSLGPRYCPSFEDKVVKFAAKESHLLHLEPMGNSHPWIYVNGLSMSLPPELQERVVHSIAGLESAKIEQYGYAVEYDYVPPTQLLGSLELKAIPGLFLAGQICGTTGYEEAAGLGLVAGINAALVALGRECWIPDRMNSYLGVMVDDLTTVGVLEPYRMFTSRAELRLSLAADTADRRLSPIAHRLGAITDGELTENEDRWKRIEESVQCLEEERTGSLSLADRIRRGEGIGALDSSDLQDLSPGDAATVESMIRYRGYLEREQREVAKRRNLEKVMIPDSLYQSDLSPLSNETRQRLLEVKPRSLAQASRVPGVNAAAVSLLSAMIARHLGARES